MSQLPRNPDPSDPRRPLPKPDEDGKTVADQDKTDRAGRNPGEPDYGADDDTPQQGGM